MEEVKNKRGGARIGAGRKKKLADNQKQKRQIQMLFSDEEKEVLYNGYKVWLEKKPLKTTFIHYLKSILLGISDEFIIRNMKLTYTNQSITENLKIKIEEAKDFYRADFYISIKNNGEKQIVKIDKKTDFNLIPRKAIFITLSDKDVIDETIDKLQNISNWELSSRERIIDFLNNPNNEKK